MLFHPSSLALIAATGSLLAQQASAWGFLGHRTVAYVAEYSLSSESRHLLDSILELNETYDISDAAVWADEIRGDAHYAYSFPWHFVDAKDNPAQGQCSLDFNRDCGPRNCVIGAIANMTGILSTPSGDAALDREALKFLLHFVGDVHQPLHAEALAWGGNGIHVTFDGITNYTNYKNKSVPLNLHTLWDTQLPNYIRDVKLDLDSSKADVIKKAADQWARELHGDAELPGLADCVDVARGQECPVQWAAGSNKLVCSVVVPHGLEYFGTHDLHDPEYLVPAAAAISAQVLVAGHRLAGWLNGLAAVRYAASQDEL